MPWVTLFLRILCTSFHSHHMLLVKNQAASSKIIGNTRPKIRCCTLFKYGPKTVLRKIDMADARSFAIYSNEALVREGNEPRFDLNQEFNTDFFDEITRTGSISSTNLSISAGSEKIRTYFSAGFFQEEGILKGNDFNWA